MADVTVTKTITRLLIANRGEIARRIIRSAHAMGMGGCVRLGINQSTT